MQITTNTQLLAITEDRNAHQVVALTPKSVRDQLKREGFSGRELRTKVESTLAEHTAAASGIVSQFIADGGELRTVRASLTKDGRKVLAIRIEEPKDSVEKALRRDLNAALAELAAAKKAIADRS